MQRKRTHYSGPESEAFWSRVNRLPTPYREELYACGVLLQNMEGSVLKWLDDAEDRIRREKAKGKKP